AQRARRGKVAPTYHATTASPARRQLVGENLTVPKTSTPSVAEIRRKHAARQQEKQDELAELKPRKNQERPEFIIA
ncbi:MAG: hypothetical protein N2C12_06225, partial [Planctomycetales bacterium]